MNYEDISSEDKTSNNKVKISDSIILCFPFIHLLTLNISSNISLLYIFGWIHQLHLHLFIIFYIFLIILLI